MAGCGKSTLGSAVANKIASNFVDTDLLIEDKFKMSLEDVKNKFGYKFTGEDLKNFSNIKNFEGVTIKKQDTSPSYSFGENGN